MLGDAEFGDNATLRRTLHRAAAAVCARHLVDADGLSRHARAVAPVPPPEPGRRGRRRACNSPTTVGPKPCAASPPRCRPRAWRRVTWRNGTNRPWAAHFAALRVTPAHDWRARAARARGLAALRARPRRDAAHQSVSRRPAAHRVAARAGALGASALGDRAAVPGTERRARARSLRGTLVCRLASARGAHRPGLQPGSRTSAGAAGARLPTLPVARAVITEILTAHFFVTRPHYLRTMQKLAEINLRI